MHTFAEIYRARHACSEREFAEDVFRKTLYPHARIFARLIEWLEPNFFAADHRFVDLAGQACTMKDIRIASREYYYDSGNPGWLRQKCYLRTSGQRMKQLAAEYLPEGQFPSTVTRVDPR